MRVAGEESTRAKTGFLANLSHEIRGPLGIILNGVELINDGLCGPVTESQRETLGMIKQNGDHLLDLVNDVLDYAKVEAGKIKAKPVKLKVGSLLTDLSNVVRSQSIAKKQDLKTDPVEKDLTLLCDKRHARQMLINLLTNAVKYTPLNGSIHISAERIPGNRIKITVADTGIGIPVAERSKVFGAFERVEDKYAQSQVGSGLGMPLTKRLAEVNKGTVDFESEQGVGSTFWLILPAAETVEEEEILGGTEKRQGVFARGRGEAILLVDRENDERDMLERYLAHQGFKVINAANGAEVLRTLREWPIDLAVVEYDLPDITGEEMVGMIRQNPAAADLPIVMLSSKAFVFDIERFLKLGVDRCLSKPVDLCEIADTARQLIDETKSIPT
jgi:CheY-like chemotaxis protein/anti-sigma regulatory factor (Ser/Thr protein kinase)